MNQTIVLASSSPRRFNILSNLGFKVQIFASEINEAAKPHETAEQYVLRMAIEKNQAANIPTTYQHLPIISADTVVALDNHILGKPKSKQHAAHILAMLSDKTHQVMTAVCVHYKTQQFSLVQHNHVTFKTLSEQEIQAYIATGESMDKAGAYGIQGIASVFVKHLSGSFTGVMGLPIYETMQLLQQCHIQIPPLNQQEQ